MIHLHVSYISMTYFDKKKKIQLECTIRNTKANNKIKV